MNPRLGQYHENEGLKRFRERLDKCDKNELTEHVIKFMKYMGIVDESATATEFLSCQCKFTLTGPCADCPTKDGPQTFELWNRILHNDKNEELQRLRISKHLSVCICIDEPFDLHEVTLAAGFYYTLFRRNFASEMNSETQLSQRDLVNCADKAYQELRNQYDNPDDDSQKQRASMEQFRVNAERMRFGFKTLFVNVAFRCHEVGEKSPMYLPKGTKPDGSSNLQKTKDSKPALAAKSTNNIKTQHDNNCKMIQQSMTDMNDPAIEKLYMDYYDTIMANENSSLPATSCSLGGCCHFRPKDFFEGYESQKCGLTAFLNEACKTTQSLHGMDVESEPESEPETGRSEESMDVDD